ncbi:MAG: hypothetical protein ACR2HG_10575 [Pyrinomonadaceae bacterium]
MSVSTIKNTMLYCPKCQQTYEDAVQRFCLNDGRRLVPVAAPDKPANQNDGVFTTILNRKSETETDIFSAAPRFSKSERAQFTRPVFQTPLASKVFKDAPMLELESEFEPRVESEPIVFEPIVEPMFERESEQSLDAETDSSDSIESFVQPYESEEIEVVNNEVAAETSMPKPSSLPVSGLKEVEPTKSATRILPPLPDEEELEYTGPKTVNEPAWQKRSPEPLNEATPRRYWLSLAGILILLVGLFGIWSYFLNRPAETIVAPASTENANAAGQTTENQTPLETNTTPAPPVEDIESPPLPRTITPPPNTVYFENNKDEFKGETQKNFLGFSLYYPKDWTLNEAKNKFLDISKDGNNGLPIEQMLVSFYNSKGTFKADKANFPKFVEKSNADLKKALQGNYTLISQGETEFQNGRWKAYEVKFKSSGETDRGEKITLWGRRLWIPTQRPGMKNGYIITLLATSLSKQIKSAEDVGVKGELANILDTFEPNQNF